MRVLLTGASGFLGRYVLEELRRNEIETVIVGRHRPQNSQWATFVEVDLISPDVSFDFVREIDASHLVHLAWYAEHGKYWSSPLNLDWVDATAKLVQRFCETGGRHVVVAGTCAEYEWSQPVCREDETALNPSTLYGTTKDAARRLTHAVCAAHDVRCDWGRIFLPYGRGENRERLIPSLIDVFSGKRAAFGVNAAAYRDFLHVSDVAAGFMTLLRSGEGRTYNVASGSPVLLSDVVKMIAELMEADPTPVLSLATSRPGEPTHLVGDNSRIKSLGWHPKLTLRDGLKRTLNELPI